MHTRWPWYAVAWAGGWAARAHHALEERVVRVLTGNCFVPLVPETANKGEKFRGSCEATLLEVRVPFLYEPHHGLRSGPVNIYQWGGNGVSNACGKCKCAIITDRLEHILCPTDKPPLRSKADRFRSPHRHPARLLSPLSPLPLAAQVCVCGSMCNTHNVA